MESTTFPTNRAQSAYPVTQPWQVRTAPTQVPVPPSAAGSAASTVQVPEQSSVSVAQHTGALEIRIDEETDRLVVSIFDAQGALLRQIPAEVVLQLARRIDQVMSSRSLGLRAEA